jgi:hypothetical protein
MLDPFFGIFLLILVCFGIFFAFGPEFTTNFFITIFCLIVISGFCILPGLFCIWLLNTLFNYSIEYNFWSWGAFTFLMVFIRSLFMRTNQELSK